MASPEDEPRLRTLAIRQDVHVITQVLSWEHTTFTTHVTLGGPAKTTDAAGATTTEPVASSSSSSSTTSAPAQHGDSAGALTNAQIGAIVGSVVGVFVLALVVICCCCQRQPPPGRRRGGGGGSNRHSRASYTSSTFIVDDAAWEQQQRYHPQPQPQPQQQPTSWFQWPRAPRTPKTPASVARPSSTYRGEGEWPPPIAVAERIPGGPKFPTYRALPIPNPRRQPNVVHLH